MREDNSEHEHQWEQVQIEWENLPVWVCSVRGCDEMEPIA